MLNLIAPALRSVGGAALNTARAVLPGAAAKVASKASRVIERNPVKTAIGTAAAGGLAAGAAGEAAVDAAAGALGAGPRVQTTDDGGFVLTTDMSGAAGLFETQEGQAFAEQLAKNGLLTRADDGTVEIRAPGDMATRIAQQLQAFGVAVPEAQ